jgi:hypothetical protein
MPRTSARTKQTSEQEVNGQEQTAQAQPEQTVSRQPDLSIHYGRVTTSAWAREVEGRTMWSVQVARSYQGRDNKWQHTSSLDERDLLPAAKCTEDLFVAFQNTKRQSLQNSLNDLQAPQSERAAY